MSKQSRKTQSRNTRKLNYWFKNNRVTIFTLSVAILLIFFLSLFLHKRFSTKSRAESTDSYNTIIGGHDADPTEWQFFVRIFELNKEKNEEYVCGGVFIDRMWIITAAHCVNEYYYEQEFNPRITARPLNRNYEISIKTTKKIDKDDEF